MAPEDPTPIVTIIPNGWEVVCPDEGRRCEPYYTFTEAYLTAAHLTKNGCVPECPGGTHKVYPKAFVEPDKKPID